MQKFYLISILYISLIVVHPAIGQDRDTWKVIQDDIFKPACLFCHDEGTSFATQSGLVLNEANGYSQLIDVPPKNPTALEDGLVRVSSQGGLTAPHRSFLWEKINVADQEHFYEDHPNYGSLMPLGAPSLTNGELKFIRAWIEAGAPEFGIVAEESLLLDESRYEPPAFQPLDPPDQGIQLHVGPFDVWPSEKHDREFLYFIPEATQEDLYIRGFEIAMREGSHHFILYNYPDGENIPPANTYRDIRTQDGRNQAALIELAFLFPFRFFIGTQTPYTVYNFPKGIALRLPAGKGFDMNSHSVNRTGESRPGEVYVNLYTVDESEVNFVAEPGYFSNEDINLPPQQTTTISKVFEFEEQRHLIQMWSHAHEHMTEFRIEAVGGERDGELLYWTNDWEHPPLLYLDPPMTFEAGDRVRLSTTYENTTNDAIQYGLLSTDEMQFLFYMYFTGTLPTLIQEDDNPSTLNQPSISAPYPNPVQGKSSLNLTMDRTAAVSVEVYNAIGQRVQNLAQGTFEKGKYTLEWDANGVSAGVYFVVLKGKDFPTIARRVVILADSH